MQIPGIKFAKNLGIHLVITDKNHKAPCIAYADEYYNINGTDVGALVSLAYDVSDKFDLIGAYSSSDFGLMSVAKISELFNLPGMSTQAVTNSLNKMQTKNILRSKGFPVPKGFLVNNKKELTLIAKELGYPIILKPCDSSGSQGVRSVWQESDLSKAYDEAYSVTNEVMAEELITGQHVDVNGLFIDGAFYHMGVFDRLFSNYPLHYPTSGIQPSSLNETQENEVYSLLKSAALELNIGQGPVKGDFIVTTNRGPYVFEVTPRFHGDVFTQWVTPNVLNINPVEVWFAYLANNSMKLPIHNKKQHSGWRSIFPNRE